MKSYQAPKKAYPKHDETNNAEPLMEPKELIRKLLTEKGETPNPNTVKRLTGLTKQTRDLRRQYDERFVVLKAEFDKAVAKDEPEMIKHFFTRYRQTPFAPAAAWFSAEKYLSRVGEKPGESMERELLKAAWYCTHAAELSKKIGGSK